MANSGPAPGSTGRETGFRHVELEPLVLDPASKTKAILIADADFMEGGMVRNSLEACGYDVSVWSNVDDARERFRSRPFDLVIMSPNLGQPKMDQLVEDLRPKRVPPKVILIADEDEGDAAGRCFLRTVVVVNRPFKLLELADIVEHLIGKP
jgi:DNA-binding response OmpR family regulator